MFLDAKNLEHEWFPWKLKFEPIDPRKGLFYGFLAYINCISRKCFIIIFIYKKDVVLFRKTALWLPQPRLICYEQPGKLTPALKNLPVAGKFKKPEILDRWVRLGKGKDWDAGLNQRRMGLSESIRHLAICSKKPTRISLILLAISLS